MRPKKKAVYIGSSKQIDKKANDSFDADLSHLLPSTREEQVVPWEEGQNESPVEDDQMVLLE